MNSAPPSIAGRDGETTIQSDAAEDHLVFLLQTTKNEGPSSIEVRTDMTPVWTLHGCTIYEA